MRKSKLRRPFRLSDVAKRASDRAMSLREIDAEIQAYRRAKRASQDAALKRITCDPEIMGGQPCIRGIRMPVATVIKLVALGLSTQEIQRHVPDLEPEDIRHALGYAAALAEAQPLQQAAATSVRFDTQMLRVRLVDGREIGVPIEWFPRLRKASATQKRHWKLISKGLGVRWPDLDEDISIPSLLSNSHP